VPVRIELGPRDLADEQATVVRRDRGEKATVGLGGLVDHVVGLLDEVQQGLHDEARARRDDRTADVATVAEASEAARTGFARIAWDAIDEEGLAALKADAVTVRCLQGPDGEVATSDDQPGAVATVARSY
jgi:prolyl-tRNA synthetase